MEDILSHSRALKSEDVQIGALLQEFLTYFFRTKKHKLRPFSIYLTVLLHFDLEQIYTLCFQIP